MYVLNLFHGMDFFYSGLHSNCNTPEVGADKEEQEQDYYPQNKAPNAAGKIYKWINSSFYGQNFFVHIFTIHFIN